MNYLESLVLGIIQGLTEFLPVSSSGHLVIFQNLFNIVSENVAFEVIVHLGTLMSVLVVYSSDIIKMIKSFFGAIFSGNVKKAYQNDSYFKLGILVIIGTIPAVFAGLFLKEFFEGIFHNIKLVGFTLLLTALILYFTKFIKIENKKLSIVKVIIIGIGQALAILPGISRSGTTISTSLFLGINREEAARFSFLLSIPTIAGAAVLELKDFFNSGFEINQIGILFVGFLSAFIIGYMAIKLLLKIIQTGRFSWFAPYCATAGLVVLFFL